MNFKLKALVAALALAVTLPASAAMTTSASGDSSLMLTLLDTAAGVSATFDLGFSKNSFVQTANGTWDIASGNYASAWSSFWGTATAANTSYTVFAADAMGANPGEQSIFTTVVGTTFSVATANMTTALGNFDAYITANNALGNQGSVLDGASYATSLTGGQAYAGKPLAYGTSATVNKIASVGADTSGKIGTKLNVFNVVGAGLDNGLVAATATKLVNGVDANGLVFNPYFNLSNAGALTYVGAIAAVPEADTSAMMLAGLGLMGFIARRRRNNAA